MTGGMFFRSGFFDERGPGLGREELEKVHNQKIMMNDWTLQHNVCTGCAQAVASAGSKTEGNGSARVPRG